MATHKPPERRAHPRQPIRLKVTYESARSLVTEYTTSVSKGGCLVETTRPLPMGTQFLFEMYDRGATEPVEIEGRVVRSEPVEGTDRYLVGIEYVASEERRAALDQVLERVFAEHRQEKARRHPRIPVNLVARDGRDARLRYLIRDLSLGGLGLRLPGNRDLPEGLALKTAVAFSIELEEHAAVEIAGEVVWMLQGRSGFTQAGIGVEFLPLTKSKRQVLEKLLRLHRPASLKVSFVTPPKSFVREAT